MRTQSRELLRVSPLRGRPRPAQRRGPSLRRGPPPADPPNRAGGLPATRAAAAEPAARTPPAARPPPPSPVWRPASASLFSVPSRSTPESVPNPASSCRALLDFARAGAGRRSPAWAGGAANASRAAGPPLPTGEVLARAARRGAGRRLRRAPDGAPMRSTALRELPAPERRRDGGRGFPLARAGADEGVRPRGRRPALLPLLAKLFSETPLARRLAVARRPPQEKKKRRKRSSQPWWSFPARDAAPAPRHGGAIRDGWILPDLIRFHPESLTPDAGGSSSDVTPRPGARAETNPSLGRAPRTRFAAAPSACPLAARRNPREAARAGLSELAPPGGDAAARPLRVHRSAVGPDVMRAPLPPPRPSHPSPSSRAAALALSKARRRRPARSTADRLRARGPPTMSRRWIRRHPACSGKPRRRSPKAVRDACSLRPRGGGGGGGRYAETAC